MGRDVHGRGTYYARHSRARQEKARYNREGQFFTEFDRAGIGQGLRLPVSCSSTHASSRSSRGGGVPLPGLQPCLRALTEAAEKPEIDPFGSSPLVIFKKE
jgi:hypothetical protein